MKATPWVILAILALVLGGGKIAAILNSSQGLVAIVVLGIVAIGILVFGKGFMYNAIGNGSKVVHVVNVEHRYYGETDDEVSMDEETKKWLNRS